LTSVKGNVDVGQDSMFQTGYRNFYAKKNRDEK